jgi:hypothetical protein
MGGVCGFVDDSVLGLVCVSKVGAGGFGGDWMGVVKEWGREK